MIQQCKYKLRHTLVNIQIERGKKKLLVVNRTKEKKLFSACENIPLGRFTMLSAEKKKLLYDACCKNDYTTLRGDLIISAINTPLDDQGNTALHIATLHGHADIIRLLLRYHASRTSLNNEGKTPEQMTSDEAIKKTFQIPFRSLPNASENHYVADKLEVEPIEWLDSYRNAYRISYENHEHMKRWITKVPLKKLLEAIIKDYIDKMDFPADKTRTTIKDLLESAIEENNPLPLAMVYTGNSGLCTRLNKDLAKLGSDFRFVSTRLDYPDNEPPKNLGQYIYASLMINHTVFRRYQYASKTFRGMVITAEDLEAYAMGKIVITRSFLSTSKNRKTAEVFLGRGHVVDRPQVMCIYNVSNPRSSLCIEAFSEFPEEEEVLIVPFIAFEITAVKQVMMKEEGIEHQVQEIELVECGPNPK
jgi:hypothetical protein